jgi:alpha-methylacyl-CoA racemase
VTDSSSRQGPLAGLKVLEMAGIGPGPYAGMLLADMGADVVRVERPTGTPNPVTAPDAMARDVVNRGKRSAAFDLKSAEGVDDVRRLVASADVLIEGFRPGVMERLGLGPDDCLRLNPRLVYGRMTGFGQDGPLAPHAGHDIGYIALTGALWATGRSDEKPVPALNLVGDYGGGSMFLVFGIMCALFERASSGRGQVVDAAMVDGAASLTTMFSALRAMGVWADERGANLLDTGAPFYEVYECADGKFLAVGALEPQFYAELVRLTGFRSDRPDQERFAQGNRASWPADKREWEALFRTKSRGEWAALLAESDACVQPVLDWVEARAHPHMTARGTFVEVAGVSQPAPAPRFSRTPGAVDGLPPSAGQHTADVMATWPAGFVRDDETAASVSSD